MSFSPSFIQRPTGPGGRRRSRPAPITGASAVASSRRRDRLAGHRYALPVVRELPASYARGDDATW